MKKIFLLIVFSVSAVHFSFSQGLVLNLELGETYYHQNNSKVRMSQKASGNTFVSDMAFGGKMGFLVSEKSDSLYHFKVQFETFYMSVKSDEMEIYANSEQVDSTSIFSILIKEMVVTPFEVSMTRFGEVESVDMENFFDHLMNFDSNASKLERAQMIYVLRQSFGEKAMKGSIEMFTSIYPKSPVKKGSTWENEITLTSVSSTKMKSSFQLNEINEDYAIVNAASETISNPENSFIKMNGELLRFSSTGTMNSTFKIDSKTGWIINSKIDQSITGLSEKKWKENSTIIIKTPFTFEGTIELNAN